MNKHKNKCPCTASDILYSSCCQPIHSNHLLANTPEKLMRARYSAYALKIDDFIIDTWSPATRPSPLSLDNTLAWISLCIAEATDVDPFQKQGTVTFSATYILDGNVFVLHEESVFKNIEGLWYYVDGVPHTIQLKVTKKSSCPCKSGKKFKRCCGK